MGETATPSGKWLMEVLRAHPRGKPLDAPAVTVANVVGVTLPAIEAEAAQAIEAAARRYHDAEWAIRLHDDEPRMTPEHNARIDEWRAADADLRVVLAGNGKGPSDG